MSRSSSSDGEISGIHITYFARVCLHGDAHFPRNLERVWHKEKELCAEPDQDQDQDGSDQDQQQMMISGFPTLPSSLPPAVCPSLLSLWSAKCRTRLWREAAQHAPMERSETRGREAAETSRDFADAAELKCLYSFSPLSPFGSGEERRGAVRRARAPPCGENRAQWRHDATLMGNNTTR